MRSPFLNPLTNQHPGRVCDLVSELAIGQDFDCFGHRTVIDESWLVSPAVFDVQIESVIASVHAAPDKPSIEGLPRVVEDLVPLLIPVNIFGCFSPKAFRVVSQLLKDFIIDAQHRFILQLKPKRLVGSRVEVLKRRP